MTQQTLLRPGTFTLDPGRTEIRCDCKAMFGTATVHGTFRLAGGRLRIGPDLADCAVSVTIDAASFHSGLSARDAHVKSASLLDVRAYPEISFTSGQVRRVGDGWVVAGDVTAHGTTQPAEVRVQSATLTDGEVRIEATCALDRTAFGVTKVRGRVGRAVRLFITAVAVPA